MSSYEERIQISMAAYDNDLAAINFVKIAKEADTKLAEKDKEIERLREQVGNIEQLKADAVYEMVDKLTGLELHEYNTLLINDVIEYADSLRKDTGE